MEKVIRYSKGEFTVNWKPTVCIHSANCARGLPNVFKPQERPWVNVEEASIEELKKTIDTCPSGALSYSNYEIQKDNSTVVTLVEATKNGPLKVGGELKVKRADGSIDLKSKNTFFCRCGNSSNKPYCDGTHSKVGFQDK